MHALPALNSSQAKQKFSEETVARLLPLLGDDAFIEDLGALFKPSSSMLVSRVAVEQLRALFSQDKGFSRRLFEGQMSVMRGQVSRPTTSHRTCNHGRIYPDTEPSPGAA